MSGNLARQFCRLIAEACCFRLLVLGLFFASGMVYGEVFPMPVKAPERFLWDKDNVYERHPEQKAILEDKLVKFYQKNKYRVYVVAINNNLGFDLVDSMMVLQKNWLHEKDGMLICVDTSTYKLHLEEIPLSYDPVQGKVLIPSLLTDMPSRVRPACVAVATEASKKKLSGIVLIDHYVSGVLGIIEPLLQEPKKQKFSPSILWISLAITSLLGIIAITWLCKKARLNDERSKQARNYSVFKFPRLTQPVRLGGLAGGFSQHRKIDADLSKEINYHEVAQVRKSRRR